ncbi:MAG: thiamine diphosphokinase [Clostridia bacterium]|nr:thiamine diphosphokinase [Clostridia bacterium]
MKAAIVLNGESRLLELTEKYIVCADGGYRHLSGSVPDCIIGDMDSIGDVPGGIKTVRHNPEKNKTDGEISVEYVVEQGYKEINIYAALGGRPDHVMGNLALLKLAHNLGAKAVIRDSSATVYYAEGFFRLETNENDIISVIPFGGEALIEKAEGLYYPLEMLELTPHDARGISNIAKRKDITLKIAGGGVLVFHIPR